MKVQENIVDEWMNEWMHMINLLKEWINVQDTFV